MNPSTPFTFGVARKYFLHEQLNRPDLLLSFATGVKESANKGGRTLVIGVCLNPTYTDAYPLNPVGLLQNLERVLATWGDIKAGLVSAGLVTLANEMVPESSGQSNGPTGSETGHEANLNLELTQGDSPLLSQVVGGEAKIKQLLEKFERTVAANLDTKLEAIKSKEGMKVTRASSLIPPFRSDALFDNTSLGDLQRCLLHPDVFKDDYLGNVIYNKGSLLELFKGDPNYCKKFGTLCLIEWHVKSHHPTDIIKLLANHEARDLFFSQHNLEVLVENGLALVPDGPTHVKPMGRRATTDDLRPGDLQMTINDFSKFQIPHLDGAKLANDFLSAQHAHGTKHLVKVEDGWKELAQQTITPEQYASCSGMTFEAFKSVMEEIHDEFMEKGKNDRVFKLYCKAVRPYESVGSTGSTEPNTLDGIFEKAPCFSRFFLLFLKLGGKADPTTNSDDEFDLRNKSVEQLAKMAVETTVMQSTIQQLVGSENSAELEAVFDLLGDEFSDGFWKIFTDNEVTKKVIQVHGKNGLANFMFAHFKELKDESKQLKLKHELLGFLNKSCNNFKGPGKLDWKGYPWATIKQFMEDYEAATTTAISLPKPNVGKAVEMEDKKGDFQTMGAWLTEVFAGARKQPDIEEYVLIISELGAEDPEELKDCELDDLKKGGISPIHANKIMKAAKNLLSDTEV